MEKNRAKIIIKASNQKIEDQTVECDMDWSVEKLKTHLTQVYPYHPNVKDQRLIYSGHLLKDDQHLKDILQFNSDNQICTVHLVYNGKQNDLSRMNPPTITNNTNNNNNNTERLENRETPATQPPTGANNQQIAAGLLAGNGYPFVFTSAYPFSNPIAHESLNTVPLPFEPNMLTSEQIMQQMAAIQQMYAQYMAQYLNQSVNLSAANGVSQLPATGVTPSPNNVQQAQPQQPPAPVERPGRVGQMFDNDDDDVNRDWLDWLYTFGRGIILLSIVYLYSSLNRFVFVICSVLAVRFYYAGMFNFLIGPRARNQPNATPPQRSANQNPNQPDSTGNSNNETEERPNTGQQIEEMTDERLSVLKIFLNMVSAFFISLIPEQTPPINAN